MIEIRISLEARTMGTKKINRMVFLVPFIFLVPIVLASNDILISIIPPSQAFCQYFFGS